MAMSKLESFVPQPGPAENQDRIKEDLNQLFARLKVNTGDFNTLTDELRHYDQSPDEYWYAMGSRLNKILHERLYRNASFRSFSDYCARGLGYSRQHTYKLMKVVNFIDEQWSKAANDEQRQRVKRLFQLGFTKLYVLHSLPADRLEQLIRDGVQVRVQNGQEEWESLEMATIGQIKRALALEPKCFASINHRVTNPALTSIIVSQARALLQLTDQCHQQLDNREAVQECLMTIRDHVSAIVQGLEALSGKEGEKISRADN